MKKVKLLFLVLFLYTGKLQILAQPPNDNPCNATVLTVNNYCIPVTGTNVAATGSALPNPSCGNYDGGDVWFKFTVPANGTAHVSTQSLSSSADNFAMELYRGTCSSLVSLNVCDANSAIGSMPEINLTTGLTPGETIWVRIWEDNNNDFGSFEICVTTIQVNNDNPCVATILPVDNNGGYFYGTNASATSSPGIPAPSCGSYSGGDVWFQTVVPPSGFIHVSTMESEDLSDGAMAIYRGNCGTMTEIICDDNSGAGDMPDITASGLTPGETIWIRFWEKGNNNVGTFGIWVTTTPDNDDPCNAIELNVSSTCNNTIGNNINATASSGVPNPGCANYNGGDVWYKAIVPPNGHLYVITSPGTLTNGGLALYRGPCNNLTLIACETNQGPGEMGEMSFINLIAGETIWIRIWDENNNENGSFRVCVTSNPIASIPPLNSNPAAGATCDVATSICSLDGYNGNTISYGSNSWPQLLTEFRSCLNQSSAIINNNSFLKFIAGSTNAQFKVWVTSTTKGIGIQMMFFEAATCGSGAVICHGGYNDIRPGPEQLITATGLIPGNTYYLMIDGVANDQCNYVIGAVSGLSALSVSSSSATDAICKGNSITLNTGGISEPGTIFTWNWTNAGGIPQTNTGASLTDNPTQTTTYNVTASGVGVCPRTKNITITVNDNPNVGISNATVCSGSPASITATPGTAGSYNYSWTVPANASNPGNNATFSTTIGGNYSVVVTNTSTNCFSSSATGTVTLVTSPSAGTLSGTQNICLNNTTNVFSSTVSGGSWSTGDPSIATINNSTGLISPVTSGTVNMTYTVTGTPGICPDATQIRSVTITAPRTAGTLSGTQNICSNNTTTSFSSTESGGTWSSSNNAVASINSNTGTITPVSAGTATMTYTVNGTGGCPNATETKTATITASPSAGTLSGTQNICLNNTTNVFSSTVSGGSWSTRDPSIATINNSTGLISPVTSGTVNMTYTVTGTPGICPDATQIRSVTITAPRTAGTLSGTQNICSNNTTTSFSSTESGGTWSSSNNAVASINSNTGTITPVSAGTATMTYTVNGTGGCPNATETKTATITASPSAGTLSGTQNICLNNTTNVFSSTVSGGSWSTGDPSIATINNSTGLISPVTSGTVNMTYTVTGTPGICPDATQIRSVTITAPRTAGTLSGTQNICSNNTTTSFSSTENGGTWSSSNNAVASINSNTGTITPVSAGTATMTYTVMGLGGCPNANENRNIIIAAAPKASIQSNNGPICKNGTAQFNINGTPNATVTYQLNGGPTQTTVINNSGSAIVLVPIVNDSQAITLLTATDSDCAQALSGSGSASLVKIIPFSIDLSLTPASSITGSPVQASISTSSSSITESIWQPSALFSNNQSIQTFTAPPNSTFITVTAKNAEGCIDTKSQFLEIIKKNQVYYIPNAFIPGRGNNPDINTLKLYGPEIKSASMKIFNQWGQCIFESSDPKSKGWDGKYKGIVQPSGVYVYALKITFKDDSEINKTGSVDLIR